MKRKLTPTARRRQRIVNGAFWLVVLLIVCGCAALIYGIVTLLTSQAKATQSETSEPIAAVEPEVATQAPIAYTPPVVEPAPAPVEVVKGEPIVEEPKAPISDAVPLSYELQQAIVDNAELYELDVHLILGVMDVESDFVVDASNGTCHGLMQIHEGNAKWVLDNAGVTDIYDPAQNIKAGCWILYKGLEITNTLEEALVWYNAGEVYAPSTEYSRSVLRDTGKWEGIIYAE